MVAIDLAGRTVDVKKTRKTAELHPTAVYVWERPFNVKEHAEALFRMGEWVAGKGSMRRGAIAQAAICCCGSGRV